MKYSEIQKIRIREFNGVERVGIRPKTGGMRDRPKTAGFDIETCDGLPYILGFQGGDHDDIKDVIELKHPGQGLVQLLRWCKSLCNKNRTLIVGAHNIKFDLGVLFYDWCLAQGFPLPESGGTALIEDGEFELWIGPVTFATFKIGHRTIQFIDTWGYFKFSLVNAVKSLGLGETKADFAGRGEPEWYRKQFPLAEIGPYCLQDAYMAKLLTDQIVTWWMEFGIRSSISGPQMAGRVFCKEFVEAPWLPVPPSIRVWSMVAYHGGRNLFVGTPGWYPHLNSYDLNSAYTWAMTQIPNMTEGEWTITTKPPECDSLWGICVVTGTLPRLKYPIWYTDDFKPIPEGPIKNVAITTMEYDLIRELAPQWEPRKIATFQYRPAREGASDLAEFAQNMWQRRVASTTPVEKSLYKLLSNSLYGKFIARTPELDDDGTEGKVAGELFYPPVAAWITALVRCLVIRAEFDYDVIHTATDGVMTTKEMPSSAALGAFKLENSGPALILRNKLYLHWDTNGVLKKVALHGFQGDNLAAGVPKNLLTMLREGSRTYLRKRLRGWKEARRDGARPFAPMDIDMALDLPKADWDRIVKQGRQEPYRSLLEAL